MTNISLSTQTVLISTTGLSTEEVELYNENYKIDKKLTPQTAYLVSYKAIFTEKYIQALKWNIPIVRIDYFNNSVVPIKKFESVLFTTSGINNPIFANYIIANGGVYQPNCSIYIDFLICDDSNLEKYKFCKKYNIPIINTADIFSDNYKLFSSKLKYDAKEINKKSKFFDLVFYIDDRLPKSVYNRLKRLIVENDGTRFPTISDSVDFILTTYSLSSKYEDSSKLLYYQYVFDCIESNSLLYENFYRIYKYEEYNFFKNYTFYVSIDFDNKTKIELFNKIKALNGRISSEISFKVTHYINNDTEINIKNLHSNCNIVGFEWVNECLNYLKLVHIGRFTVSRSLKRIKSVTQCDKEYLFQFTGCTNDQIKEITSEFDRLKIKYIISDKFEKSTHLIMGEINTSEKLFCSIVNGCWIIKPEFISEFGKFISDKDSLNKVFEKYEWKVEDKENNSKLTKIIKSIKTWRQRIQSGGKKPYYNWKIKLYCNKDKYDGYKKLIESGGGTLTSEKDYTHVFVDKNYKEQISESKNYSIDYLFLYLFK
ncbi:ANR32 [Hepatospora eriocheir]|uniref:ANR32 n=1 Tax=Hepatospora eriocheir TaxID=1081669 RepID=A0A1X0QJV2_9MICR|nr:ANR32 [Hepatospora eriocheir]